MGERTTSFPPAFWSLRQPLPKTVCILLICFCNDLRFCSTVTPAQSENFLLCSVQAEVEHLHTALSSSSHMVHLAPKITLTIVVVHHCQHLLPYSNSDFSVNATTKHTHSRNTFPSRLTKDFFPSFGSFSFSQLDKTCLRRPSATLFLFHSY